MRARLLAPSTTGMPELPTASYSLSRFHKASLMRKFSWTSYRLVDRFLRLELHLSHEFERPPAGSNAGSGCARANRSCQNSRYNTSYPEDKRIGRVEDTQQVLFRCVGFVSKAAPPMFKYTLSPPSFPSN